MNKSTDVKYPEVPFEKWGASKEHMVPWQRKKLVHTLLNNYSYEQLAVMTDRQLHNQWLVMCGYINASEAALPGDEW